jgi:hypothetical protein
MEVSLIGMPVDARDDIARPRRAAKRPFVGEASRTGNDLTLIGRCIPPPAAKGKPFHVRIVVP